MHTYYMKVLKQLKCLQKISPLNVLSLITIFWIFNYIVNQLLKSLAVSYTNVAVYSKIIYYRIVPNTKFVLSLLNLLISAPLCTFHYFALNYLCFLLSNTIAVLIIAVYSLSIIEHQSVFAVAEEVR